MTWSNLFLKIIIIYSGAKNRPQKYYNGRSRKISWEAKIHVGNEVGLNHGSITEVVYRDILCIFEDTANRISRQNCTGI